MARDKSHQLEHIFSNGHLHPQIFIELPEGMSEERGKGSEEAGNGELVRQMF